MTCYEFVPNRSELKFYGIVSISDALYFLVGLSVYEFVFSRFAKNKLKATNVGNGHV